MSTEIDGGGRPAGAGLARSNLDRVSDPLCPSSELALLAGGGAVTDRMIAIHKNAEPVLLQKLANGRDALTKQGVAGNPNTPLTTLFSLVDEFPREFILNPAFNLMLLENPGILETRATGTLVRILEQPECPVSILHWAAVQWSTDGRLSRDVMQGIARNPATPPETLEYMLGLNQTKDMDGSEGWL